MSLAVAMAHEDRDKTAWRMAAVSSTLKLVHLDIANTLTKRHIRICVFGHQGMPRITHPGPTKGHVFGKLCQPAPYIALHTKAGSFSEATGSDVMVIELDDLHARTQAIYQTLEAASDHFQILNCKLRSLQWLSKRIRTLINAASKLLLLREQAGQLDRHGALAPSEDSYPDQPYKGASLVCHLWCKPPWEPLVTQQSLHPEDRDNLVIHKTVAIFQWQSQCLLHGAFVDSHSPDLPVEETRVSACHHMLDGHQPRKVGARGCFGFTLPTEYWKVPWINPDFVLSGQNSIGLAAASHGRSESDMSVLSVNRSVLDRTYYVLAKRAKLFLLASVLSQCPTTSARPTAAVEVSMIERAVETAMLTLPYILVFASTLWACRVFFHPSLGPKNLKLVRMLALVAGTCWIVFQELVSGEDHIKPISLAVWYLLFAWQFAETISHLRHWRWNLTLTLMIGTVLDVVGASILPVNAAAKGGPMEDLIRKATEIGPVVMLVCSWSLAEMQELLEGGLATRPEGNVETGQELDRLSTAISTSTMSGSREVNVPDTGGWERANL